MTVANNYTPTRQTGNGVTTAFSFNFKVNDASQIVVYEKDGDNAQTVVNSSDYSVTLTNSGGMVTFNTAPANGIIIAITRSTPQTQETPYKTSQGFPAAVVEGDFDKLTMMVQELQQDSDRSIKTEVTSDITPATLVSEVERIYTSIDNVDTVADIASDVSAVASNGTDISAVAANETNINAVATNETNINAVAGNATNINAVNANKTNIDTAAGISSDITTVSNIATAVSDVANNETDISAVAADLTNIDAVASDLTKIVAVADDLTNIDAVADDLTNIDAVNANKTNIDTAAGIASDITTVSNIATAVSDVADNETNINTVAGISSDVSAVATIATAVSAVADNEADISAVNANKTNIDAVAGDLTNIDAVANDLANIDAASTYADNANIWAEGTDEQVQALGGVHSSKGWAEESASGQVNSNWTEADPSSKAYILNKPNLATVATSGSYDDLLNKPTIPAAQVNSDWDAVSGVAEILNKPTKLSDFTNDLPIKEGIPVSVITNKRIEKSGSTVNLWWNDPFDTIIDGFVLSSWASTTIVKKQGSEPESVDDGTVVAIVTTRNQYANTPLTDTQDNADQWYYRAFPLSVNGVYSLDKRNCFATVVYGYRINKTDSVPSTRVEYLQGCDNYFFNPCQMNFLEDKFYWGDWEDAFIIPKPCLLKTDGTVDFYLSKTDFRYKEDGSTASNVETLPSNGNFMCEFPSIFVKTWEDNKYIYVMFSNQKLDDDFECWATKQSDGTYADHFYLPMFEGTVVSSVMRSYASNGKPTASTTAENEATYATANGTGWNTTTWADEMLMMLLFPLLFRSTDSQSALGYGATASSSALTVNNNAAIAKGMMYGTSGASAYGMTYLGMHNWWGHRWRRPNGLMNDNGNYKFKLTHSTVDGSTTTGYNRTANGYISSGITPPAASQSYINAYQVVGKFGIVPNLTSGSSTTYYCDGMWTNNGQLDQLILGGAVNYGAIGGVFCFDVANLPSASYWHFGASLSYHHL